MLTLSQLFFNLLLPAIVCGGIYAVVAYIRKSDEENTSLLWLTAVAIGIGYIVGYLGIEKKITFLPIESIHWLFYFTLFAIFSSTYWDFSGWRRLISQLIYSVALPRILLNSYFQYNWGTVEGIIWWVCLSVGVFIFWNIVIQSFSAIPSSNASIPFVYFGISGGTALIIALSGSVRIAQHAGTLVALFAVIWILTIVLLRGMQSNTNSNLHVFPISVSPLVTFLFVGIWMNGYFYAEAPSVSIILLAVSPFLAQVGKIPVIQQLKGRKSVFIQVGLIALCVSIAIIIAVFRSGFFGEDAY
ncbi:MAG: hypothetical protein OXI67_00015 [Candidatus Poribacteria bacterium]|nr:hypothetical protein [Candidatus Poribacteria bacterium]